MKISLYKFQQIDEYMSRTDLDDQDKLFFAVCVVFDYTEYELDKTDVKKVFRMCMKVTRMLQKEMNQKSYKKIGVYEPNYDPSTYTLGQFISLSTWSQQYISNAHKILSTITQPGIDIGNQDERADYFLSVPMNRTVGSIKYFMENFRAFLSKYKRSFGLDKNADVDDSHPFMTKWGWIYSATRVALHNGVSLDEAMQFNVKQAFNDLAYLKAKDSFDAEQIKRK